MHRKSSALSLLVRELLATILFFPNRLIPSIVAHLRKTHAHTRIYAPTHARACTAMHTYYVCMHAHSQTHAHACKHAQTDALARRCMYTRAKHMHTRAHVRTLAQMHACTRKHTHACMSTHTPYYNTCQAIKYLKQGKNLITKKYCDV